MDLTSVSLPNVLPGGTSNSAIFQTLDPNSSSGSGTYVGFLRIQGHPTERGYNTDGRKEFDTKGGGFTKSKLLSEVPLVTVQGEAFREFGLDLNEGNAAPDKFISLDRFQLFLTSNPALTGYPFTGAATLVYDFDVGLDGDTTILMKDVSKGSGKADVAVYVPQFFFQNHPGLDYVVLYSEFGVTGTIDRPAPGTNYNTEGGFEEWAVVTGGINALTELPPGWRDPDPPPPAVPEPSTFLLFGVGLAGMIAYQRKRRRP